MYVSLSSSIRPYPALTGDEVTALDIVLGFPEVESEHPFEEGEVGGGEQARERDRDGGLSEFRIEDADDLDPVELDDEGGAESNASASEWRGEELEAQRERVGRGARVRGGWLRVRHLGRVAPPSGDASCKVLCCRSLDPCRSYRVTGVHRPFWSGLVAVDRVDAGGCDEENKRIVRGLVSLCRSSFGTTPTSGVVVHPST